LDQAIAIVDIGKTRSKLSLWSLAGAPLRQADHANRSSPQSPRQLDVAGIDAWLRATLAAAAAVYEVRAIVPVGHGAAAVLMRGDEVVAALDYEQSVPADVAAGYGPLRDPFAATLSPRLPDGLNLGVQMLWLERLYPDVWPAGGSMLLWPQYWAWRLSGERAAERTSLGCHSDLWRPREDRFSDLALRRGWAGRLGALRRADEVLGPVRSALAAELGLPANCEVRCGLHDSNAALHAARGLAQLASAPFAVVSTGTWFVTMAAGGAGPTAYDPSEDMLGNVDVAGQPVPTARFMGGRDYETWMGDALGAAPDPDRLVEASTLDDWPRAPPVLRATRAALELARKTDRTLALVAAEGPVLLEGRFAEDRAFAAALAALRPGQPVYRSRLAEGVALGALRLAAPWMGMAGQLERMSPAAL
jgi:sugar (pentulose or hexulose) kinase